MSARKMNPKRQQRALGFSAMLLGVLTLIVPLWPEFAPEWRIGGLLVLARGAYPGTGLGIPVRPSDGEPAYRSFLEGKRQEILFSFDVRS